MATITVTSTENQTQCNYNIRLRHSSFNENNATVILTKLVDILEKFSLWNDEYSLKLHKVADQMYSARIQTNFLSICEQKIMKIFSKILINPLAEQDPTPLIFPVLDRGWLWERETLISYLKLSSISPFDGKEINMIFHDFAYEITNWANTYFIIHSDESSISKAQVN